MTRALLWTVCQESFAVRARYAATVVRLAHALEQNRRVRFRDWSTK
ncbi:hypothetical protein [Streptomyces sp. NPDC017673]